MMTDLIRRLSLDATTEKLKKLYGENPDTLLRQRERYISLAEEFKRNFGEADVVYFSSPGRTEIGGNHTDHNKGRVLAAAVTLDTLACVAKTDSPIITLYSRGYDKPFVIDTRDTDYKRAEEGSTHALLRGVCALMKKQGYTIGGYNAVVASDVLSGSGLSSSAAFEVLLCAIMDGLYNGSRMDPVERAKMCQIVENKFFGKPSGLMDQSACSVGGLISIDFEKAEPVFKTLSYDFDAHGMAVVVLATRSSHDDLTDEYASIPAEMKAVAAAFGKNVLREVDENAFYSRIGKLRAYVSDRAVMRAMHFFAENNRVAEQVQALLDDDLDAFMQLVIDSGESSWKLLQNLYVGGATAQSLALACAVSQTLLAGRGAWRVHGGGFAGTTLNFVPKELLPRYVATMDGIFGKGACTTLGIRGVGAAMLTI